MDNSNREKIDLYLLNKMDQKMRDAFEAQMATDEALTKEVQLQKEAFNLLDAIGDQKMRNTLDQIHHKVIDHSKPGSTKRNTILFLLGLSLILALAYFFSTTQTSTIKANPERAYIEYYESYPLSFASRDNTSDLEIQQVNALYKNQQYKEALPIIERLITQGNDSKLQLAAGISALQINAHGKALVYFDDLINRKDPLYQNQAKWYAALTALKTKNLELAQNYLQALIDSNGNFKKKESQKILRNLK